MNGFDFQVSMGCKMRLMFEAFQPDSLEHWPQTTAHWLMRGLWLNVSLSSELITFMQCSCVDGRHSRDLTRRVRLLPF